MEDDEIIIGINVKNDSNKKSKNNKKKSKSKAKKKTNYSKSNSSTQKNSDSSIKENNSSRNEKTNLKTNKKSSNSSKNNPRKKIIKFLGILILVFASIIILLSSSLFNIKTIEVSGNNKLSNEKIISLSSLELYTHILGFKKNDVIEHIKENAYIENVKVTRIYPNTVSIQIEEREARYMLQFADSYVYINNQGYMLEISNEKLELPILVGFTTDLSNIKAGNRINVDDLKKMNTVIKIYDSAKLNELENLITKIDISNSKNYNIELASEGKIVYLGNCSDYSDLKTRMLYLKSILEKSKGKNGELFLDVDLNSEKIRFKEKIG